MKNNADIKENEILKLNYDLLYILLKDRTTDKNIIWATNYYKIRGPGYFFEDNIKIESITGCNGTIIKPRVKKSRIEQEKRIKDKAEVFTPSWVCNSQNNLIDNAWFEEKNIFNKEIDKSWRVTKKKIKFPTKTDKNFEDYIKDTRLEVSCGEAPYLVSRYDNVTGEMIKIQNRIGLLDRKFRVINENIDDEDKWNEFVEIAYKNTYAFEYQGDNLLIARENLLFTYIDNYVYKFKKEPSMEQLIKIATIISWNIWQMDGIKFVIPHSCRNGKIIKNTLFGEEETEFICIGCEKNAYRKHNGIYCKIMNWETNRKIKYISLLDRSNKNGKK